MSHRVTVQHVVELDDRAVEDCFNIWLTSLGGGKDCYIDDKGVVWEDDDNRHGSSSSSKVEKPSEVLVLALQLKAALRESAAKTYAKENKR